MSQPAPNRQASKEELVMIRDAIMLPYMLTMCDKSLQEIKHSTNLFKRFFERFIQLMLDSITADLSQLKREMIKRKIKVYDEEMADGIIYHRYACRGYEDRFGIMRETLRYDISFKLSDYAAEIFKNPGS